MNYYYISFYYNDKEVFGEWFISTSKKECYILCKKFIEQSKNIRYTSYKITIAIE